MTIKVNSDLMRLAADAVSSEFARYYLHGVFIEPHHERGALMVSTDGHRMVVVHDPDAICDESAIVKFTEAMRRKSFRRSRQLPRFIAVDVKAKTATVTEPAGGGNAGRGDRLTAHDVIVDGTYPEWKKVVPAPADDAGVNIGGFNPKYVRMFGRLGRDVRKTMGLTNAPMRLWQADDATAAIIRWDGAPNIFSLLMPMKWHGDNDAIPAFFKRPETKPETKEPATKAA